MKNMNERISEQLISHAVDLSRVSTDMKLRIVGFLHNLEKTLVKQLQIANLTPRATKRTKALIVQANATIAKYYNDIAAMSSKHLQDVSQLEFDYFRKTVNTQIGLDVVNVALTSTQLKRIADNTLIQGAPSAEWWKLQDANYRRKFKNEIRQGMANGESMDEIVRRIRGRATRRHVSGYVINAEGNAVLKRFTEFKGGITDISTRQAETLVRTSVQTVSNQARLDTMRANSDILDGFTWLSTLDTKTSVTCINLDGKSWTLENEPIGHGYPFPGPTAHWRCRSIQTSITKSWDDLGLPELQGVEIESKRSSMDGQVSGKINYPEWLGSQSKARQLEVLGKTKYKMYNDGSLSLSQMVDQRANPLSIAELKRKVNG